MASGRNRVLVNRQPLKQARDLLGVLRVTRVLARRPRAGEGRARPSAGATSTTPSWPSHPRYDALRARGRQGPEAAQRPAQGRRRPPRRERRRSRSTCGTPSSSSPAARLADGPPGPARPARCRCWSQTYDAVAHGPADVTADLRRPSGPAAGLAEALAAARRDDLRRGVSTVGPHRDDVELQIGGLPARTHASQGEQRSLALALRLAAHHVITEVTGSRAGPAARRRVQRARPRPQRRPARQPPAGPDPADQRQRPAARRPAPTSCCAWPTARSHSSA